MARVTVEDCIDKMPNRFELVLVTANRARDLRERLAAITVERENDKDAVVALREIAEKTISPNDMREMLIHSIQEQVEIDEPEAAAAPLAPVVDRLVLGRDEPGGRHDCRYDDRRAALARFGEVVARRSNQRW